MSEADMADLQDEAGNGKVTHTRTCKAYEDTITQYHAALRCLGQDLESGVRTLAMVAQQFAASTSNPLKEQVGA